MAIRDNAYVVTPKLSDLATITASGAIGNAGASNLQIPRPKYVWRSTTATPYLQLDFGVATVLDTLVLGYLNGVSSDTYRLRLASTQAKLTDGTAESDSGSKSAWGASSNLSPYAQVHARYKLPAPVTLRWARIDFNFASNPAGYVQLGRLILGARVEPAVSVKSGWVASFNEPVAEVVDLSGEESPRPTGAKRMLQAIWHDLVEPDADELYTTLLERGSAKDFALCLDPDATAYPMRRTCIGRAKQAISVPQTQKVGQVQHFTNTLLVSELAPLLMK